MKKFLVFFLISALLFIGMIGVIVADTTYPDVYYEGLNPAEHLDERVNIRAMRDPWYSDVWSVENEAGEFIPVEDSADWTVRYTMFEKCDPSLKKLYDEGKPVKLTLYFSSRGEGRIMDVYEYDHTTFGELAESMPMILGVAAVGIVAIIIVCIALSAGGPTKRYRMEPPRQERNERTIVSVRILDSSGPVYGSKTSTASAVGRAFVGDMLAGPTGAIIGATTAKQNPQKFSEGTMTFRITWSDGSQTTETVSKDSYTYKKLIEMVP